jgi:hypothetical protein
MITVDDLPWGGCHTQDSMIASIRRHCATQASIDKWFDKEMKKDEQAGKLIYQMLAADPDQRPSLEVLHKQVTENKEVIKKSFIKLADELGYE